jgi:DNA polymerase-3 subunit delta
LRITRFVLDKNIKQDKLKNLYFLYGEEKYLVRYYAKKLQDSLVENRALSFNFQRFWAEDLDLHLLDESLKILPIFSNKKCVEVINFFPENLSKKELEFFKKIVKEIPQKSTLIISQRGGLYNDKISSKQFYFLKFLERIGDVVEFKALDQKVLLRQLISWAKDLDCVLDEFSALKIISKFGKSLDLLKNELSKICAFSEYKNITPIMIDEFDKQSFETTSFLLSDAIIEKRYSDAFTYLSRLILNKNDYSTILAAISVAFIDFYRIIVAFENNKSLNDVEREFGYKGSKFFRIKIASKKYSMFSKKQVADCIDILNATDVLLKSSKINKEIVLQKMIAEISLIINCNDEQHEFEKGLK